MCEYQCECAASNPSNLNHHKTINTLDTLVPWCEFPTTNFCNLNQHKVARHEGIRYACDQC